MSASPDPLEPALPGSPEISEAAQVARQRLHEEIERVRLGVEEMLDDHDNGNGYGGHSDVRRELEDLRIESRDYIKKRVAKSEKRLKRTMRELDARADKLERRIDQVEADREAAEVRIHNDTERMLDGLLGEIRGIADRLSTAPVPARPGRGPQGPRGPQLSRPVPGRPVPPARPGPAPRQAPVPRQPAAPDPAVRPPAPQGPIGRIGPPGRRAR